jgi:DNA invertase Pin-like site-specific DNA recombinase
MLRAVGYARISKDDTLEGRGVARQTQDITAVCERHGWHLAEVLVDNDISASRYSKKARPGFARLLELITAGSVDRAVAYDLDRLLRQPKELEQLIDLADTNGGFEIHAVTGEIDLRTSSGRFTARVLVSKAAMESDDLSRRLRRASDQRAAEGKPHGARAFGYEPDGMTIRESEAALFRQAAADVLNGAGLNEIARRWNDAGILTPQRGKEWNGTVVKATLTGPRHAGLRVHRREVVGPAAWPALIDRETHDRLVALLNRPRARRPARRTAFTGLIRSAETRLPLDRDQVRGRACYRAHNRPGREAGNVAISAEPLELLIVEALFAAVEDGRLAELIAEHRARRQAAPDLATIEADLRGLAEDHGTGRITRAEWLAARGPLEARLQAAQAALNRQATGQALEAVDLNLRATWPGLDVDRRRAVLGAVFEGIYIAPSIRRGGPAPMVEGIGRIDLDRIDIRWQT